MRIKEVIVVEGRGDERAVKAAVDAEVIITSGFGITPDTMKRIEEASKRCGIIIFTDPDHPGEMIRKRIAARVVNCKHAFLPKAEAIKNGDLGIENARPEHILAALSKVRTLVDESRKEFDHSDMIASGLIGDADASERRATMGKILGIGYGNAKQFLKRLNAYNVSREEFENALLIMDGGSQS